MSLAYVLMALIEEEWLKQLYGAPYRDYCRQTARFLDMQELIALRRAQKALTRNELMEFVMAGHEPGSAIETWGARHDEMVKPDASLYSAAAARAARRQ